MDERIADFSIFSLRLPGRGRMYVRADGAVYGGDRAAAEHLGREALRAVHGSGEGDGGRAQVHEDAQDA